VCALIAPWTLADTEVLIDVETPIARADIDTPLEIVIVRGRARELYRTPVSDTGKLLNDPLSTSQIITSINKELISDQGARVAQDLYRNISGVSTFSYSGFTARGFRQEEIFYDGLRGNPYVSFSVPELFNIDRVDFLKGPAGMLYGPGAPGGLFNYVTKKPEQEFSARLKAVLGDNQRIGGSGEVTGGLPIEGLSGRLGIFYESRDTPRNNSENETAIYDAGLAWDFESTRLIVQATQYEQDQAGNRLRGVPVDDKGNFLTSRRWSTNEPTDFIKLRSLNFQATLAGRLGDDLTWDFKVRKTDSSQTQEYHEPLILIDLEAFTGSETDGIPDFVARQFRDQERDQEQLSLGANVIWSKSLGRYENRLLAGYEYFDGDESNAIGFINPTGGMISRFVSGTSLPGDVVPLAFNDPQYRVTHPQNYNTLFLPDGLASEERQGFYLLNEIDMGRVVAVAGVRYDRFEDSQIGQEFDDNATTFRLGLIYKIRDDISIFSQWADSYQPQSIGIQIPQAGGPFEPTEGVIIEAGIKVELLDGHVQSSATVYQIIRENLLLSDPAGDPELDGIDNFVSAGEVTSRGFEWDMTADLTDDWVLTMSYGYNDTRITEDNEETTLANSVGDNFANAPRHQLGFWTRYQVATINTAFAFGGDYVSDRISLSDQAVQSSFVFDASIIWERGPYELLFRIDNIFDETYAQSGFNERSGHFPGAPRSMFIEVSRRW
jgi:iron complex outermembrane receptor protein